MPTEGLVTARRHPWPERFRRPYGISYGSLETVTMAFAPHLRMTALGRLGSTNERFSYGLNLAVPGDFSGALPTPNESNAALLTAVAARVRAFHANPSSQISTYAVLTEVKFALIAPSGQYQSDPYVVDVVDAPGGEAGAGAVAYTKAHDATAVSLVTTRRGPTGKGRFYLPMSTTAIGADLLMPPNYAESIRDSAQGFLQAVNDEFDAVSAFSGVRVVVASTKGYNTAVTGVRVGRVPDVIQSRSRSLAEAYTLPVPITD